MPFSLNVFFRQCYLANTGPWTSRCVHIYAFIRSRVVIGDGSCKDPSARRRLTVLLSACEYSISAFAAPFIYRVKMSHVKKRTIVLERMPIEAIPAYQRQVCVTKKCLCNVDRSCCMKEGMCAEDRVLLTQSPRRVSDAFIASVPASLLVSVEEIGRRNSSIELMPVIKE